jgi:thiamine-monophosphate kinase
MCDVSDGLLADLGHIATASGVAVDVRRDAFTVARQMADAAQALGKDPWHWVLAGGEDHALVATFPATVALGDDWQVVGSVLDGTGVTVDGAEWDGPTGHDHFAR